MISVPKWYVITLGSKGYEQVLCQSQNPQFIQQGINHASKNHHFVITIIQVTDQEYDQMFTELYSNR